LSSATPELVTSCRKCGHSLTPGALVCDHCRSLVYANELQQISFHAKSLEQSNHFHDAKHEWASALKYLPAESKQAAWIRDHLAELEQTATAAQELGLATDAKQQAVKASIAAFLFSFAVFIVFEAVYGGWAFGIGFSAMILLHELGHFVDIRRRGMTADLPVFIPGIGAFVRFRTGLISPEVRAGVSLAGPFAGFLSAAACALIWYFTGQRYWAWLAQSGAWLNLLNLTPVWVFDGGQAASAFGRPQRFVILAGAVALWIFTKETAFFVVAAGALFRVFQKDTPLRPSARMASYFFLLMALLGAVMYIVPGTGFGTR
jgi:Zn-dependent protease